MSLIMRKGYAPVALRLEISATEMQPGVYDFPEQSTTLVFMLLLHPLSASKALARQELPCSQQMGKSNRAEAPGLLSCPSSSCWHTKDFKSRIFKATCVDCKLLLKLNHWAGNKCFWHSSPTDTRVHSPCSSLAGLFLIHRHPQVPLLRTALNLFFSQPPPGRRPWKGKDCKILTQ